MVKMKSLYGFCLVILVLQVCKANINLCLLRSDNANRNFVSDGCDMEDTILSIGVPNENNYIYHVIKKRDVTPKNFSNVADISDKEGITQLNTNVSENVATPIPHISSMTDDVSSSYDPDSGVNDKEESHNLNTTMSLVDHHRYYKSFLKQGNDDMKPYWIDFDQLQKDGIIVNEMLSDSYRRALTVQLSFRFPFYGHILDNVTIATGGFLFTGDFLHKWLAATQYIAPLMANFDTSVSKNATVKYVENGTSLTVQWENVLLQDNKDAGPFTFQVTINTIGSIIFAYSDVPKAIYTINDNKHPVKVGLSDAYIVEKTIFYLRKKTIYEYHKIDMKNGFYISNHTAIVFQPLPNCVQLQTCDSCLIHVTNFKCEWCQKVGRCSDGFDRHRQDWIEGDCLETSQTNVEQCANLPPFVSTARPWMLKSSRIIPVVKDNTSKGYTGGLVITLIILALVAGIVIWVSYAYYHPHTASGMMLIKYRPTTWSWRSSGAKYTAATINSVHM